MANNPPNPGDTNTPNIPTIDWGAIQVPVPTQTQATPASINWGAINTPSIQVSTPPVQTQGAPSIDWSSIAIPADVMQSRVSRRPFFDIRNEQDRFPSFDEFMTMIALDSSFIQNLSPHVPGLQEGLDSGNEEQRMTLLREVYNWIQMVNADSRGDNPTGGGPDIMDPEIQERIAQAIKQDNVKESRELAMEHAPEMFGRVEMLYIHCKVNSHPIVAFIDSGAQMSIMSRKKAEECGVMRLVDHGFAGMARGVGTAPILGRVHMAQLEIENRFLPCSFSIMEQTADLILGLDMLKRHQCVIDLEKGRLVVTSAQVDTPFLSESEVPEQERMFSQGTDVDPEQEQTAITDSVAESQMEEDRNIAEAIDKSNTPD